MRVFKQQNPDGDWPQWFMFFERERNIRPGDSHGDIVFWPVLALAQYLAASEDASILDEAVPFFAERDELAERDDDRDSMSNGRWRSSETGSFPAPISRPMATATGMTRCNPPTRPCAKDCAALGR